MKQRKQYRTHVVACRVTASEKRAIEDRADALRIGVSGFIRQAALGIHPTSTGRAAAIRQ